MYGVLAALPVEWGRVSLLFGDERCVPPSDPESNYLMAKETLLSRVDAGAVLRIPGELGAEDAAALYDAAVGRMQPLDLVLLGIGEDGHCASLFPGHPALNATGWVVPVHDAPKPPPDRVSLTLGCLRNARRVIFLVTGAGKADAFRKAQAGEVPAGMIPGAEWIVDREAAG
jgi:6-phosphogluconolactonase